MSAHWSRATRAWATEQDWLTLARSPAYAPELNPVELLWSSLKKRKRANHAGDHLADDADATEQGIHRISATPPPAAVVIPRPYRPDHPPTTPTELTKISRGLSRTRYITDSVALRGVPYTGTYCASRLHLAQGAGQPRCLHEPDCSRPTSHSM
ncbi:transposase [Streptomyces sp. NPDC048362]|uniref:transposase n=1 Tax=Streptomyces sp. NPDC048362 TaxID=3365539 RepID=UPI00371F64CB